MSTLARADDAARTAEQILNAAYLEYMSADRDSVKGRFLALKLQACLIQFEMCVDFAGLLRAQPAWFARKVFLKNALHKIVEYTRTLRGAHLRQLAALASARGLDRRVEQLQRLGARWRRELNTEQYRLLRNKASGHYDENIREQVGLIAAVREDTALETVENFLRFNQEVLSILKAIGREDDV